MDGRVTLADWRATPAGELVTVARLDDVWARLYKEDDFHCRFVFEGTSRIDPVGIYRRFGTPRSQLCLRPEDHATAKCDHCADPAQCLVRLETVPMPESEWLPTDAMGVFRRGFWELGYSERDLPAVE